MYREIRSYDNYLYANIVLNRLKDEGFNCYLKDENTVTIDPLLSPAIGGMKLMVLEPDVAAALALLDQIEAEYLATVPCPVCGKQALQLLKRTSKPKSVVAALISLLLSGSSTQEIKTYKCTSCGHMMDELPTRNNAD